MKKLIVIVLLLCVFNANAATVTVSGDCSASAVQTAITGASAGDIIDVTCTGTVEWSSTVTLSGGKTLKGGGSKTGNANTTTGTWPLTINITHNSATAVQITNAASQQVNRLTGFKFQGNGTPTNIITSNGQGVGSDSNGAFRIDNNYFNEPSYGGRVIRTDGSAGKLTGLLDHNVFYYQETSTPGYGNISYQNTSRTGSASYCVGYEAWKRAIGFGTDDFVFYEDNYFLNSGIETSEGGGKIVSRYNYYTTDYAVGISGVDGHGADTLGQYCIGVIAAEFYNNTLSGSGIAHAVNMRGGQWMVHDNTISNGVLQIDEYRLRSSGSLDWKACTGEFCCPTTPAQCDIQQPTISDFASCYPVLNQVQNTYLWNNSDLSPAIYASNETIAYYIAENRNYWIASTGLAANIPETCTTGAGYWATDTSVLYKCTSTDTWGNSYTPYTYPHPLRGEGEDPTKYTLTVTLAGTGEGEVTSSPAGIDCGETCTYDYDEDTEVTLTATPTGSDVFAGWSGTGGCTGTSTCVLTMDEAQAATATFNLPSAATFTGGTMTGTIR